MNEPEKLQCGDCPKFKIDLTESGGQCEEDGMPKCFAQTCTYGYRKY